MLSIELHLSSETLVAGDKGIIAVWMWFRFRVAHTSALVLLSLLRKHPARKGIEIVTSDR